MAGRVKRIGFRGSSSVNLSKAWYCLDAHWRLKCLVPESLKRFPVLSCLHPFREIGLDCPLRLALVLFTLILARLLNMLTDWISEGALGLIMLSDDLSRCIYSLQCPIFDIYSSPERLANLRINLIIMGEQSLGKSSLVRRGHLWWPLVRIRFTWNALYQLWWNRGGLWVNRTLIIPLNIKLIVFLSPSRLLNQFDFRQPI